MTDAIAVALFTDGRKACLVRTIASFRRMTRGPFCARVIFDDSADDRYAAWLRVTFPDWQIVSWRTRRGFSGTIGGAWSWLLRETDAEFVVHLEDDFRFVKLVEWRRLAAVLAKHKNLAQMALVRQPWNDVEIAAGGVLEVAPERYLPAMHDANHWLEHRVCFTTNPCIYRRSLLTRGWPNVDRSEGIFTHELLNEGSPEVPGTQVRFAYWQGEEDRAVWVYHIGAQRIGTGY